MINSVTIVGNMGQDPEIRYTPNAVPVASFTVAVNEVYTGKDGQKVKKTHWFRVTAFKRLAEIPNFDTLKATNHIQPID